MKQLSKSYITLEMYLALQEVQADYLRLIATLEDRDKVKNKELIREYKSLEKELGELIGHNYLNAFKIRKCQKVIQKSC